MTDQEQLLVFIANHFIGAEIRLPHDSQVLPDQLVYPEAASFPECHLSEVYYALDINRGPLLRGCCGLFHSWYEEFSAEPAPPKYWHNVVGTLELLALTTDLDRSVTGYTSSWNVVTKVFANTWRVLAQMVHDERLPISIRVAALESLLYCGKKDADVVQPALESILKANRSSFFRGILEFSMRRAHGQVVLSYAVVKMVSRGFTLSNEVTVEGLYAAMSAGIEG